MKLFRRLVIGLVIAAVLIGSGWVGSGYLLRPAYSQSIGDILLLGGIVLVVATFGDQIDDFINSALGQREAQAAGATKVVPIIEVGQGTYVGAAQVVGVPNNVRLTQAVAAVNVAIGNLNGSALVPISTRVPGRTLDRVSGVGISAVIDFRL